MNPRLRSRQRGFTLVEMITVIAVIGILVAAAAPSFIGLLRDRRVDDAARTVAEMYRLARTRAMGRGAATAVRFDSGAILPNANFVMKEAVTGASPLSPFLPSTVCNSQTNWTDGDPNSLRVGSFDNRVPRFSPAAATFVDWTTTTRAYAEVCFTPRGRTFIRFANNVGFTRMAGVPRVNMANTDDGNVRAVVIPPTGVARVVRRVLP